MAKIPPGIPHARLTERCIMTTTNARRATVSESIIINLAPVADHIASSAVSCPNDERRLSLHGG